jgi:hypothetical protein
MSFDFKGLKLIYLFEVKSTSYAGIHDKALPGFLDYVENNVCLIENSLTYHDFLQIVQYIVARWQDSVFQWICILVGQMCLVLSEKSLSLSRSFTDLILLLGTGLFLVNESIQEASIRIFDTAEKGSVWFEQWSAATLLPQCALNSNKNRIKVLKRLLTKTIKCLSDAKLMAP